MKMNQKGFTLIELMIVLVFFLLIVPGLLLSVYGLSIAFSASVILGIAVLLIEPLPLVFGVAKFFFHVDLAVRIMQELHK